MAITGLPDALKFAQTTIYAATASIQADPVVTICEGDSAQLNVAVGSAFKYQWLKNGQEMQDANSASITIADSGAYQVRINSNWM